MRIVVAEMENSSVVDGLSVVIVSGGLRLIATVLVKARAHNNGLLWSPRLFSNVLNPGRKRVSQNVLRVRRALSVRPLFVRRDNPSARINVHRRAFVAGERFQLTTFYCPKFLNRNLG